VAQVVERRGDARAGDRGGVAGGDDLDGQRLDAADQGVVLALVEPLVPGGDQAGAETLSLGELGVAEVAGALHVMRHR